MIRHICMFRFPKENKDEIIHKALQLAEPLEHLSSTTGGMTVTNSLLAPQNNYDICLIYDFNTIDDLNDYQQDPTHLLFKNYVVEHMTDRACIDYEI